MTGRYRPERPPAEADEGELSHGAGWYARAVLALVLTPFAYLAFAAIRDYLSIMATLGQ
jgi:hypothetical protein